MPTDEKSHTLVEVIPQLKGIPSFSRGKDIITVRIFQQMAKEPHRLFCIKDFVDIEKSERRLRSALESLIAKKMIKKLNSYPKFYCVIL